MKLKKTQQGFTLVELMVATAMIAILSTVVISNFRVNEKKKRTTLAADVIINAVRNAQNLTLTSKQISNSTCTIAGIGDKSPKAYVMNFTASQTMSLYGIDKCDQQLLIESYPLAANLRIQTDGFKLNGTAVSALQFKFTPPFATPSVSTSTSLNQGTFGSFTTATITIENTDGSNPKTITVNGISGSVQ